MSYIWLSNWSQVHTQRQFLYNMCRVYLLHMNAKNNKQFINIIETIRSKNYYTCWVVTSVDDNFLFGDSGKLLMSTYLTGGRSVLSYSTTTWVPEMSISFFVSSRQVSEFMLVASESSKLSLSEMFLVRFRQMSDFFLVSVSSKSFCCCSLWRCVVFRFRSGRGETSDLLLCRGAETNDVGVTIFGVNWR